MSASSIAIKVDVIPAAFGTASTVTVEVGRGDTGSSVTRELLDCGLPTRGAWQLYEKWNNCSGFIVDCSIL